MNKWELCKLPKVAGIGHWATRPFWAKHVNKEIDSNPDGRVSWETFNKVVNEEKIAAA